MADFSKYTNYANNAGVSSVVFGAGSTVLEVELNEMQEIQTHFLRELIRGFIGNGISDISKLTYTDGEVMIDEGCNIICDGYIIKASGLNIFTVNGMVYLWVWEEEADYNSILHVEGNTRHKDRVENWIKDDRADNETTRRKVIKCQLRNTVPTLPTISYVAVASVTNDVMTKLIKEINLSKLTDRVTALEVE